MTSLSHGRQSWSSIWTTNQENVKKDMKTGKPYHPLAKETKTEREDHEQNWIQQIWRHEVLLTCVRILSCKLSAKI